MVSLLIFLTFLLLLFFSPNEFPLIFTFLAEAPDQERLEMPSEVI